MFELIFFVQRRISTACAGETGLLREIMFNDEGLNDRVNDDRKNEELDDEFDDFLGSKPDLELQGVDPKRGWGFRGVHKVSDGSHCLIVYDFYLLL
ncbi:hypothetical protein Ahy_B09g096389 isoform B [Arachis hypogaea]|uniref:Uncharacterized protein n=1 Tax=Arachis hypogaea TaxID=3818 RepID=A0A444XKE3_ARAHY|nr:hypothetical protein Ahy_B09g096389 isoform B [Arachis hypogaea]